MKSWLGSPKAGLAGLLLGACLMACAPGHDQGVPIRIGVLVNVASSESALQAAELAVGEINDGGGIEVAGRRHRVELLVEDTRALPNEAIDGVRRLVQSGVVAIVGPDRSRDAIAAAGVAENSRTLMVSPISTHPDTTVGKRFVFRVSFTDTLQGRALARFAAQDLGLTTAAVLYDIASSYNRNLATVFKQAFEAMGGRVSAVETYTTGESDFSPQLQNIRAARPQLLFLPNYHEEVTLQAEQARAVGVEATLLGGDSWSDIAAVDLAGLEGAFFAQHWHLGENESDSHAGAFATAFRDAYQQDPSARAALTYDAFGVLFHAIRISGQDPDRVREAFEKVEDYPGVTGAITYRDQGGDPPKRLLIVRVREGKTARYVEVEP